MSICYGACEGPCGSPLIHQLQLCPMARGRDLWLCPRCCQPSAWGDTLAPPPDLRLPEGCFTSWLLVLTAVALFALGAVCGWLWGE